MCSHTCTAHIRTEDLNGSDLRISGVQRFSIYDALFISNNEHPPPQHVKERALVAPRPFLWRASVKLQVKG